MRLGIYLGIFVLLAFASVAVMGFLAMGDHGGPMHGCIASVAGQAPCPDNDPLGYVSFHLSFFKSFSSAFSGGIVDFAALLIVLAFLMAGFLFFQDLPELSVRSVFLKHVQTPLGVFRISLNRWLSFYENSPSFRYGNLT
ncbi:MAG: hypothetical protein HY506_00195 [Candidatus Yanofskybacteria bacterium]|nr:hypothetical protein [Candidatus Yanofskybacteria bacterium]